MLGKKLNTQNKIFTPASHTTIAIDYSTKQQLLEVEFDGGKVYHYLDVEPSVWQQYKTIILGGGSSGGFVNAEIKPKYRFKEIRR